jgi:NAD(P)-dependent dehydrogenase (short-subunit alcohol dehydrogenase family)
MLELHGAQIKEPALMSSPVVLITGALTGIGRATAVAFAHERTRIVVSGRHDDERQKLATELRKLGTEAEFVRTDLRHEEEVKDLVDKTIARFGRLDIAVNHAGTVGNPGSAADLTPESYQAIFDTNVLGVLLCMKYEIRAMLRQGKGSIVNISSSYGKVSGPTAAVYVGSKHAVEALTKSVAIELAGTGVRVNIVGPDRRKRGCSTTCSLALRKPPTLLVHPRRWTEGCSRVNSGHFQTQR